ncbi:MAG: PQQ-binding-like beta-propeller repeat protein [Verrucomicrobia bacterium]|nr:PQQ-binding-like beta-propeller repeat protein [Verrucomicrobiota bacterium]
MLYWAGATSEAFAEDWPRFLGPRADNTSFETGLLEKFPTNGPPVSWQKEIGTGYSAPSVRGDLLALHHRVAGEEVVEAVATATGKPVWRHAYPSRFVDPYGYNNGPRCTPLLTSNLCYTFGAEGKLLCLELKTGKLVWQRDTARDWKIPDAFFGVGSTPILEGDKLIVMVGGQPNSGVVALDANTGKTIWESVGKSNWQGVVTIGWRAEAPYNWSGEEKLASYSTPFATTIHGQRHLFCLMRQGLVSLNPTNGAVNFSRWFQSFANDSVNAMCPVVQDDLVLISAAYYRVGGVLLRVKPDGKSFDEVWRSPRNPMERDSGRFVSPALEIHWSTPVVHNGFVYAFSGRNEPDANFRCVEFKTGKVMWERNERWPGHPPPGSHAQPDAFGRGSAILADGKLIALGEGGLLGLFKPTPEKVEEISRWQVPGLHFPCWAAPALSRGRLFLRSEDHLVCLDLARTRDAK